MPWMGSLRSVSALMASCAHRILRPCELFQRFALELVAAIGDGPFTPLRDLLRFRQHEDGLLLLDRLLYRELLGVLLHAEGQEHAKPGDSDYADQDDPRIEAALLEIAATEVVRASTRGRATAGRRRLGPSSSSAGHLARSTGIGFGEAGGACTGADSANAVRA